MATITGSKRLLDISANAMAASNSMTYGGLNVATESWVSTQIANLVSSAPATLDTLNELAAALGDDPNFATTITTALAGKLATTHDMTLTLSGDASGSATFTNMGNATLTVAVANDSHTHDGRYYTESEIDTKLAGKLSTTGKAADSNLLDGIDSTGFVKQLGDNADPNYQTPSSRRVDPNASNPTNEHYAITTFGNGGNVTGQLATHFQNGQSYLRAYNSSWSGWRKIWDSTNFNPASYLTTSGKAADSNLLDGLDLHTGRNNEANKVVRTDANGYIQAGWINTTSGDNGTTAISRIYASQDGYIRYYTPANFRALVTNSYYDAAGTGAAAAATVNTRIDEEVLPAIDGKQAAGNYFTDGDTVLNMANNDGLVYDDTNNRMYVKLDGTNREIYHTGNFTDSSSNWNTAYNNQITAIAVSGTTTKTITLTQQDGGTLTADFTDAAGSGGDGYLSGLSFNTGNGVLTGTITGGTDVTVDLDGRYAYSSHDHDRSYITDSRGAQRAPSYYNDRYAQWDFQNTADTTAGGDSWHALLTVSKWSSFDPGHRQEQLIFTGDNLKRRTANSDAEWGELKTIWDTGNLDPVIDASVSNDTITFTRAGGGTFAVTTSDANTWRPIDDTPVNGVTDQSISSNWAYDHANANNPHGISLSGLGLSESLLVDYLEITMARHLGWVPAYGSSVEANVSYDYQEEAVKIKNPTDTSTGASYKAVRVKAGDKVRFTIMAKASVAIASGFYLRLYQYDGNLPNGKTHVSNSAGSSSALVQEDSRGDTSWVENAGLTTDWVTYERTYTAAADGYVSLVALNWDGAGANVIYISQPDIQFETNDSFVDASVSNDTITFTRRSGGTVAVTTSDANTWRGIDDTPVNGQTAESISSNWAYDHVNASNPHGTTLADLGYTGATNANYITNNNQLTNGAGYITGVSDFGASGTYSELSIDSGLVPGTTLPQDIRSDYWMNAHGNWILFSYTALLNTPDLGTAAAAATTDFVSVSGDTMTGHLLLQDSKQLRLGTDTDLILYHSGASATIKNNTGNVLFENHSDDGDIIFKSDDGSGGVATYFYLDGGATNIKFDKSTRHTDNAVASFGISEDLKIYHDGTNSYIDETGTGNLYIRAHSQLVLQRYTGETMLKGISNGAVELYYDNAKKLETTSTGVSVTGAFTASGDVTAFSDIRVKENIQDLEGSLDKVTQLRGVSYNKIGSEEKSIGVIAQEIREVLPEVVKEGEDGMLSVAYGNITAVLIEAVKEQQKQIDELKAKLDGLTK